MKLVQSCVGGCGQGSARVWCPLWLVCLQVREWGIFNARGFA